MTRQELMQKLRLAVICVMACEALYRGREAFTEFATTVNARCRVMAVAYVRLALLDLRDHLVCVVNGSDADLHDWVVNLQATQTNYEGMRVHSGFAEAADLCRWELRKTMPKDWQGKPIVFCGHSSGGAVAELLALAYGAKSVITFGAPRVISAEDAAAVRAASWDVDRYVFGFDPVPLLPLRNFRLLFGGVKYSHTHEAMVLDAQGALAVDRSPWRWLWTSIKWGWLRCVFSGVRFDWLRLPSLSGDHSIERYSSALKKSMEVYQVDEEDIDA